MKPIYLDFNTTTPVAPSVIEKMAPFWCEHFWLPSQGHLNGNAVAEGLEEARQGVAALLGCDAFEVVFTSGGTEANNLAILGIAQSCKPGHVIVSVLEHESVWRTVRSLTALGWSVSEAEAGEDGVVSVESVEALIREDTRLVCLQAANPVLGTIQPVRQVADRCRDRGILLHCDAVQLCGKGPMDVLQLRADTVAISGHKFYGPKGTGALYVRRGLSMGSVMHGESREMGLRPGAENVSGWVGFGAACSLAARCAVEVADTLSELQSRLVKGIRYHMGGSVHVLCEGSSRLSNTVTLQFPVDVQQIRRAADRLVFLSARSTSPADEMTRCLRTIGQTDADIQRTLRISLGWTSSRDQLDRAVDMLVGASKDLAAR